tara:strand:+ start:116 stop:955 length:840 start_codon:yes stop_codon:yes gene_type:complete
MIKFLSIICSVLFLFSCGGDEELDFSDEKINEAIKLGNYSAIVLERDGIKLTEVFNIPKFKAVEASLEAENQRFSLGENKIEFQTKKFNIGQRTVDQDIHKVRNEERGQYLSVTRNNGPAVKQYGTNIEANLKNGENYFLCFLNRSYDISLKVPKASILFKIDATPNGCSSNTNVTDTAAYVIHQPSGIFTGLETGKILLDFYLKNISIGKNGNYAVVKINQTEFKLSKWAPYWITGLKKGKHIITIEIFSKDGKKINSVFPNQCISRIELKTIDLFEE